MVQPVVGSAGVNLTLIDDAYRRAAARVTATQAQLNTAMYGASAAARTYGQSTNVLTNSVNRLTTSLTSSIIATAGYALGVNALRHAIGGSLRAYADWERGLVAIGKTADLTDGQLSQLGQRFETILTATSSVGEGQAIATTAEDLLQIGEIAGQLGVTGVSSIANFTETVALMRLTTTLSAEEASNALGRLVANTTATIDDVQELGSAVTELGNRFLGGEQAITSMAERIARATAEFNLEPEFLLGISAALSAAGNEAEQSSTVIQRGLRALQNAANQYISGSNPTTLESIATAAGLAVEELFNQISNRDWRSAFLNLIRAFEQTRGLAGDSELTDSDLFRSLFGGVQAPVRVAQTFGVLERQLPQVETGIRLAEQELEDPTALFEEAQRALETYSSRLLIAQNDIDSAMRSFGELIIPLQVAIAENWRIIAGTVAVAAGALTQFFAIRGFRAFQARQEKYLDTLREDVKTREGSLASATRTLSRETEFHTRTLEAQTNAQERLRTATRRRLDAERLVRSRTEIDERNTQRMVERVARTGQTEAVPDSRHRLARAQEELSRSTQDEARARRRLNNINRVAEEKTRRVADQTQQAANATDNLKVANDRLLVATRPLVRVQRFLRNAYLALGGAVGLTLIAVQVAVAAFTFWRRQVTETSRETEELTSRIASLNAQYEQLASSSSGATSDTQLLDNLQTAVQDIDVALETARERVEELDDELNTLSPGNFLQGVIFNAVEFAPGQSAFGTWVQELTNVHAIQTDIANQEELINRLTQDRSSLIEREANARQLIEERSQAAAGDPEQRFTIPIERTRQSERQLADFANSQVRQVEDAARAIDVASQQIGANFVESLTIRQVDELTSNALNFIEAREQELARLEQDIADAEARRSQLVQLQQETTAIGSERYKQYESEIASLTGRIDENTAAAEEQAAAIAESGQLLENIPALELTITEANERAFYNQLDQIENQVELEIPVDLQLIEGVEQFIVGLRRRLQDTTDSIDFGESLLPTYSLSNRGEGEIQRQAATEARNTATAIEQQRRSLEDRRTEIENTISALERQLDIDREYQRSLDEFAPEQLQVAQRIRSTTLSLERNREQLDVVSSAFDLLSDRSAEATQDLGDFESNARRLVLLDINRQIAQIENEFSLPGLTPEDAQRQAQQFAREFRREMTRSFQDIRFTENLVPTFSLANQGEGEAIREAATATREYVDQVQDQRSALRDARREIERSIETQEDLIAVYRAELAALEETDPRRIQYTRAIRDAETALARTTEELHDNISAFDSLNASVLEAALSYQSFLNIARRAQIAEIESQIAQIENAFRLPELPTDELQRQAVQFAQEMQRELEQAFSDIDFAESLRPLSELVNRGEETLLREAANAHRDYVRQAEERLVAHRDLQLELSRTRDSQRRLIDVYRQELAALEASDPRRIDYVRAINDTERALERTQDEINDSARAFWHLTNALYDARNAYDDFEEIARRSQINRIAEEIARIQRRVPISQNAPTQSQNAEIEASAAAAEELAQRYIDVQRERAELLSITQSRVGEHISFVNRGDLEIERQAIRQLNEYERALFARNAALADSNRNLQSQIAGHEESIARWEAEIEALDLTNDRRITLAESIQTSIEAINDLQAALEDNRRSFGPHQEEFNRLFDRFVALRNILREEFVLKIDIDVDEIENRFQRPLIEDRSFLRRVEDFGTSQVRGIFDQADRSYFDQFLLRYAPLLNRGQREIDRNREEAYHNLLGAIRQENRRLIDERREINRIIVDLHDQFDLDQQTLEGLTETDPERRTLVTALKNTEDALVRENENLVQNTKAFEAYYRIVQQLTKAHEEFNQIAYRNRVTAQREEFFEIITRYRLPEIPFREARRASIDFERDLRTELSDLDLNVQFEESLSPLFDDFDQGLRSAVEAGTRAHRDYQFQIVENIRRIEQEQRQLRRGISDEYERIEGFREAQQFVDPLTDPRFNVLEDAAGQAADRIEDLNRQLVDSKVALADQGRQLEESADELPRFIRQQTRLQELRVEDARTQAARLDQLPEVEENRALQEALQTRLNIRRQFADAALDSQFETSQSFLSSQFGGGVQRQTANTIREITNSLRDQQRATSDNIASLEDEREAIRDVVRALELRLRMANLTNEERIEAQTRISELILQERDLVSEIANLEDAYTNMGETRASIAGYAEEIEQRHRVAIENQIIGANQLRTAFEYVADGVSHLEDAFVRLISTGQFGFKEFVNAIIADLARIAIRMAITLPLLYAFRELIGTGGGAAVPSGFSGASLGGGSLPPQLQGLIPAFHSGGIIDGSMGREQLVVLERGEEVLTRNDPRHRYNAGQQRFLSSLARYHEGGVVGGASGGGSGGGSPNVSIELVNRSSSQLQVDDGGQRVEGGRLVQQVVLSDLRRNGPIAQNVRLLTTGRRSG